MTQSPTRLPAEALTDAIGNLKFLAKILDGSGDFNTASRITNAVDAIIAATTPVAASAIPICTKCDGRADVSWCCPDDACPQKQGSPVAQPVAMTPMDKSTQDQIASVMLQHGSDEQKHAALAYVGAPVAQPAGAGKAPERIWLIDYQDDHEGTLWCQDSVGDADIEYVRADLAAPTHSPEPVAKQPSLAELPSGATYRCRRCGNQNEIEFNYATTAPRCCGKSPCEHPGVGSCDKPAAPQLPSVDQGAVQTDPLRDLIRAHSELLESNPYAYFELAYTRRTAWMAWLCDRPSQGKPGTAEFAKSRKVIVRGQGDTAEEACRDALEILAAPQPSGETES